MGCRVLSRIVAAAAALLLCAVFLLCFFPASADTLLRVLAVLALLAAICALSSRLPDRALDILLFALLAAYAVVIYIAAYQLKLEPAWDFGRVYFGAKEIIINNSMAYTDNYFLESYNNFFCAVYVARFVQLCALFGTISVLDGGILLNVISIALSALFICLAARTAFGARAALMTGLLCFGSAPLLSYSPVFYTDTLALPYVSLLMLIIAEAIKKDRSRTVSLLLGAAAGACAFVGYRVKAYAAFPLVAAAILLLLDGERKKRLRFLAGAACCCAALFAVYNVWIRGTDMLDYENIDKYRLPAAHYVYMGLVGNGGYNDPAHQEMDALPDADARTARSLEKISKQLDEYGFSGLAEHLVKKIRYTWSDGLMYSDKVLEANERTYTTAQSYASPHGLNFYAYRDYAQGFHYAVLLLLAVSSAMCALKKRPALLASIAVVAVFGLALLLLVWETRSRYLVSFIPLYALAGAAALDSIVPQKPFKERAAA